MRAAIVQIAAARKRQRGAPCAADIRQPILRAHAGDHIDIAQVAARDQIADVLELAAERAGKRHRDDFIVLAGVRDQRLRIGGADHHRLLDQHMAAGVDRVDHLLEVIGVRADDQHGVERGLGQHRAVIGEGSAAGLAGEHFGDVAGQIVLIRLDQRNNLGLGHTLGKNTAVVTR